MTSKSTDDKLTEDAFAEQLREKLRAGETTIDTATQARLAAARRDALAQTARTKDRSWILRAPALGTAVAVAAVAVVVSQTWQTENTPPAPDNDIAAPELSENQELLEFYEDLEFYEWLAETEFAEMTS